MSQMGNCHRGQSGYDGWRIRHNRILPKAFTIIELLVVIAILALLLAISMLALSRAKELASAIPCMSNVRSLATAAYLYQEDNDGILVSAYTGLKPMSPHPKNTIVGYRHDAWAFAPLLNDGNNIPDFYASYIDIEYEINGIKAGKVWPYLETEKTYHCPADKRITRGYGFRTYSMIMTIRDCHGTRALVANRLKYEIHTMYDVKTPGSKMAFVEAIWDVGLWNYGGFTFDIINHRWLELPAAWHSDGVVLGFLDGHAEKYKWKDPETRQALADPWTVKRADSITYADGESVDQDYFARCIPQKE